MMWIKNPADHVLFSHKFFEDYHDEWRRWCMISLSYSQFMEKTHQGYLSKYSWSDVVLHTREAFNHVMEHMKRGCFDVLLGCGNQELDRQLSSAIEDTRQAMFTQVNDFKKRQVTLMLQLQQHDHVDLQKIQSDLIQHWSTLCQEHASTSAAQLPLIHHLQQQTEGMQGTSSMRHNHMITKALHNWTESQHHKLSPLFDTADE
ncbi:hypothetical protein CEUSTIGMA_g5242.t1 [Chlamydomonas eustigma]|uniref:Uncharacterized protein n=1 Tax=Chlamydomonas eustigma TaxID=1157962 RepID=A0A250X4F6_9CHLO|nr:hypothetical protein CEUSTIGMA_g5242.t1 [Chlamydomonas eustigma]|eukprot:GAX77799.1 hypothetical protein CEUSTIGMA_g5242.t1 [Chlamydomonas eustigma]